MSINMSNNKEEFKVQAGTSMPTLEEEVLAYWDKNKIFEQSVENRKGSPKFTFYDGPPFANGLPHYGHILAQALKDLMVRYKTMRGYYVPRRNGWDCHGLPVEFQIEKELGISGKKEIEEYGIDKFNDKARKSVYKYVDTWTETIRRVGRWVDFDKNYATLDQSYIESVWWVFSELWNKGLIYKDFTSLPYCPRCETSLSNFETNQGYKDNTPDPSVFVKFAIIDRKDEYFLAWTTTPWTLPANLALAVDESFAYGLYEIEGEKIWVAKELAERIFGAETKLVMEKNGSELVGTRYQPLFGITDSPLNQLENIANAYQVLGADFVTLEDGTGIVHVAPAYGEADMALGKARQLPLVFSTDYTGKMITDIAAGMFIKDADPIICADLKSRGLLWREGIVKHTYPFCWRCDTPLIYMATSSWFVKVSAIREQLVELNKTTKWQPAHIRDGRFGKWLEGARDWNIGRKRFWGAPIPVWECSGCGQAKIVSSIKDLGKDKDFDPHRPYIDEVTFKCDCGGTMHRVPDVFDCWFESGSMPYAQWHYPFEHNEEFMDDFPADFISEGLDQTRGWFYTLHVLATAIFNKPAYKNVVVNGLILAENGQKLSKRLRNYPQPSEVFDEIGADALRQYLYSATQIGEDYRFSKRLVQEEERKTIAPLWNTLLFYKTYLVDLTDEEPDESGKILDEWIMSRYNQTLEKVTKYLDDYDLTKASRELRELIGDLSLWYLRLSRKRKDKQFKTTLETLLGQISILIAPFMPFIAEVIYQTIPAHDKASVHMEDWPEMKKIDDHLISDMAYARNLVEMGHSLRAESNLKVRQPLSRLRYSLGREKGLDKGIEGLLLKELNIIDVVSGGEGGNWQTKQAGEVMIAIDTELTEELIQAGDEREIIRTIQSLRKESGLMPKQTATIVIVGLSGDQDFEWEKIGLLTYSSVTSQEKIETSGKSKEAKLSTGIIDVHLMI